MSLPTTVRQMSSGYLDEINPITFKAEVSFLLTKSKSSKRSQTLKLAYSKTLTTFAKRYIQFAANKNATLT